LSLTSGKGILEDLLKAEELEAVSIMSAEPRFLIVQLLPVLHGQVYGGVQSEAALVRAESRVELDTIAPVDLEVALVVLPDDAELDDALGDRGDLEGGSVLGELLEKGAVLKG